MSTTTDKGLAHIVEELRATGYHGRESWLANLPRPAGMRYAALRQFEVAAEQIAVICLDGEMPLREKQDYIQACYLPRLSEFSALIGQSIGLVNSESASRRALDQQIESAWQGTQRMINSLGRTDEDPDQWEGTCLSLLISAMALRQLAEHRDHPQANGGLFVSHSSNIHTEFFSRCIRKLGEVPFDAVDGTPVVGIAQRISSWGQRPTKKSYLQSVIDRIMHLGISAIHGVD